MNAVHRRMSLALQTGSIEPGLRWPAFYRGRFDLNQPPARLAITCFVDCREVHPKTLSVLRCGDHAQVLTSCQTPWSTDSVLVGIAGRGLHGPGIVARTKTPELFIGKQGTPEFRRQTSGAQEGIYETPTLEGVAVIGGFHRSSVTGWMIAFGVPKTVFTTELQRELTIDIRPVTWRPTRRDSSTATDKPA